MNRSRPVLIVNPRSGGRKAERVALVDECDARGIEPIVFAPGDDLVALAARAIAGGAGAIGVAGGDGTQALVAAVASEHDVPFVCIPAGTRNHFAADLGVDRGDVVGALDAFAHGIEQRIDLARVNGRVFVNNVSLGVYASIVQSPDYRDAKFETVARLLPELLPPRGSPFDLAFDAPDGTRWEGAQLVLVSNNAYRVPRPGRPGARGALDDGTLGVIALRVVEPRQLLAVIGAETGTVAESPGWLGFDAASFTVDSSARVDAAIDGEACVLEPPLHFECLPAALRVRVLAPRPKPPFPRRR